MNFMFKSLLFAAHFLVFVEGFTCALSGAGFPQAANEYTALLINLSDGETGGVESEGAEEHRSEKVLCSYLRYGVQVLALSGIYLGFNWCFTEVIEQIPDQYKSMESAAEAARLAINFSLMSPWLTPLQSTLNRLFFRMGYHFKPKASGRSGEQMEEQWKRRMQSLTLNQQIMIDRIAQVHAAFKAELLLIIESLKSQKDKVELGQMQDFCIEQVAVLFLNFKRFYIDFDPQDEAIVNLFSRDLKRIFEFCSFDWSQDQVEHRLLEKIQQLYIDHQEEYDPYYVRKQIKFWIRS